MPVQTAASDTWVTTFGPEGLSRVAASLLQVDIVEIIVNEADEPNAVFNFLDAERREDG
jgi:hypothetical protein